MARKKTFTAEAGQETLFDTVSQATGEGMMQVPADEAEAAERRAEGRTQGRAGVNMKRIMMAFDDDNYEYLKNVGSVYAGGITGLVNQIIRKYRENHPDIEDKANELREMIEGSKF